MIFQLITVMLLFFSCNKTYDLDACNDLSIKKFRGFTDAKKKLEVNCQGFKIKYTEELCQAALNELILSSSLADVKAKYGDPIEGCFSEIDLKKYNTN